MIPRRTLLIKYASDGTERSNKPRIFAKENQHACIIDENVSQLRHISKPVGRKVNYGIIRMKSYAISIFKLLEKECHQNYNTIYCTW